MHAYASVTSAYKLLILRVLVLPVLSVVLVSTLSSHSCPPIKLSCFWHSLSCCLL